MVSLTEMGRTNDGPGGSPLSTQQEGTPLCTRKVSAQRVMRLWNEEKTPTTEGKEEQPYHSRKRISYICEVMFYTLASLSSLIFSLILPYNYNYVHFIDGEKETHRSELTFESHSYNISSC